MSTHFIEIGRIYREHGVKGFCTFYSHDDMGVNLKKKLTYILKSPQGRTKKVRILEVKPHGRYVLLRFDCFSSPEEVRFWRQASLLIAEGVLDRRRGELYDHEWVGLSLCCGKQVLGKIDKVIYTPQKQFVLTTATGQKLIPYVPAWVVNIDLAKGTVDMILPVGL